MFIDRSELLLYNPSQLNYGVAVIDVSSGASTFSTVFQTPLVRSVHGDSSGVRGAAWLWPATGTPRP